MKKSIGVLAVLVFAGCGAADNSTWGALLGRAEGPVRIATYNIHHWKGSDEEKDVERIARVIRDLQSDVIAIQEVDNNPVDETVDDFGRQDYLTELVDHRWIPFQEDEGETFAVRRNGVLVAPHVEVIETNYVDISEEGRDPRAFTETILELKGQRVRVIGVHVGLNLAERQRQIVEIGQRVGYEPTGIDGTIVAGDFNEWNPFAKTFKPFKSSLKDSPSKRTFPARNPLFRLDRIWISEHASVERVEVVRNRTSVQASDHLPIRAEVLF